MSTFEFIAVFVAIIFGLSLTQILSGAVFLLQRKALGMNHLGWTLFVLHVLVLNWWTFFPWSTNPSWEFEEFFAVLVWALAHYAMASALCPSRSLEGYSFEERRSSVLWAFIAAATLDMVQMSVRGDLFDPWYYSIFVIFLIAAASVGLLTRREAVHQVIPWLLILTMFLWSMIERRVLQ